MKRRPLLALGMFALLATAIAILYRRHRAGVEAQARAAAAVDPAPIDVEIVPPEPVVATVVARKPRLPVSHVLRTAMVVGLLATVAGYGTYSLYNDGSSIASISTEAGTIVLSDNDLGANAYSPTVAIPGDTYASCIKVTYSGSLDAYVHLYGTGTLSDNPLVDVLDLSIVSGTGTQHNCSDFAADASNSSVYSGTLKDFMANNQSWASGIADNPLSGSRWQTSNSVTYRITASIPAAAAPNAGQSPGYGTGTHSFVWEARNT